MDVETTKKLPNVSIIIPAFNQAKYIKEAVQSVLSQTYPDFEVVIVNDGSTDNTGEILSTITDERFKVIWQPNAGLSAARNTGIRASSAPLISLLDSDDLFLPDKLEVLVSYLDTHPDIGMVAGGVQYIDQNSRAFQQVTVPGQKLGFPELLMGNPFVPCAVLFRRTWIDQVGMFDENLRACEDWDLWQRMAYAGCQFTWVEYLVAAYRFHLDQMTRESGRMRKAINTVLNKFFSQPDLPEKLKGYKNIAFARGFIHSAAFAYNAGEAELGKADLREAINLDNSLSLDGYTLLTNCLVGWSNDPRSGSQAGFIQHVISNPPEGQPGLTKSLRKVLADVLIAPLFSASRDDLRNRKKELLQAVFLKPSWLLNRGVIKMLARAWIY